MSTGSGNNIMCILSEVMNTTKCTSNVTGCHQGLKQKLRAGYRAMSHVSTHFHHHVLLRTFSALCVYSTFGHHPHPLGYLCAFVASITELAHGEKLCTHSLNQSPSFFDAQITEAFASEYVCSYTFNAVTITYTSILCMRAECEAAIFACTAEQQKMQHHSLMK